jgi:hypothetical protein
MMDDATLERGLRARPPADPAYRSRITRTPPTAIRLRPIRTGRAQPGGTRPMFTAIRLTVAIAIASLSAGALLFSAAGGPSPAPVASPSPSPWAPPAGWVTEEIEPGVFRVLSDGIRTVSPAGDGASHELAIGTDGSIWIATTTHDQAGEDTSATLVRLGDATTYPFFATPNWNPGNLSLQVAPDGSPWVLARVLARLTPSGWVIARKRPSGRYDVAPDGTVWMAGDSVIRLTPSGWAEDPIGVDLASALGVDPEVVGRREVKRFEAAPDGSVWVGLAVRYRDPSPNEDGFGHLLLRFDGVTWSVIDPMGIGSYFDMATFDIGADGTAWVYLDTGDETDPHLARLSDGEWSVFTSDDGVGIIGDRGNVRGLLAVAPDGKAWMRDGYFGCQGVRSFDGSAWRHHLDGICVGDLDIAPDGTVWVTEARGKGYALNARADDIFLIDPAAAGRPNRGG